MLPGPSYRGLTTMWTLFTGSLNWELNKERVPYGTPSLRHGGLITMRTLLAGALWYSKLSLRQLGSRPTVIMLGWATHLCIQ